MTTVKRCFPLNEADQHNRRTSVQTKPSLEALNCVQSTPLTASSPQNMWDLLAGNRTQELPLSVCHEIVPLPLGLSSRDYDLIKFLCKIIIQIAFNVPQSFGLKKKLEKKTRLTCCQFYNLLLLLINFKNLELHNNQ